MKTQSDLSINGKITTQYKCQLDTRKTKQITEKKQKVFVISNTSDSRCS